MKTLYGLTLIIILFFINSCKYDQGSNPEVVSKNITTIYRDSTIKIDTIIVFNSVRYHINIEQIPSDSVFIKKVVENDTIYFYDNLTFVNIQKNGKEFYKKTITKNLFEQFLFGNTKNDFILFDSGIDSISKEGINLRFIVGSPDKKKYHVFQNRIDKNANEQQLHVYNNIYGKKYQNLEYKVYTSKKVINLSLPQYEFKLYTSNDTSFIYYDSLVIQDDKNRIIQTIYFKDIYDEEDELWTSKIFFQGLDFIDLNFDGYLDLDLFISAGATGNYNSLYWLFEPDSNLFIYNDQLSNLVSLSVDSSQKLIYSYIKPGDAYEYESETYKYINGTLTLIRKESFLRAIGKKYHEKKIYERKQGKLRLISKKHEKIKGYDYDWFIKNNL